MRESVVPAWDAKRDPARVRTARAACVLGALMALLMAGVCLGAEAVTPEQRPAGHRPTQEEFLRSMKETVDSRPDAGNIIAVMCAAAGVVLLLVVVSQRQKKQALPRPVNHSGKLVKEVLRQVPVERAQMKRLKVLAEQKQCNPLTLMLCPSLAKRRDTRAAGGE